MRGVSEEQGSQAKRYLPHAVLATALVALLPIAAVWSARAGHVISSPWACVGVTVALSLIASAAGSWYWKRRPGSGDVLFSDLLLWGWVRRLHVEHQLDDATKALGLVSSQAGADAGGAGTEAMRASPDIAPETPDRRLELLTRLADAMEAHDPYVGGHSRRVARHATVVARKLGLSADEVTKVARAAAVHDVGKLRLPREILMKPGTLTAAEFEVLKRHSTEGAEMVACLGDPELTAIVRHHHERLDGSGYPAGLRGEEIPLGARIIAVADTFDAITSARPYRPPARHKQAIDILIKEAGVLLDADAVRAFVSYYSGSRILVLWAFLTAIPQRAVGWARRASVPTHSVSAMPTAAGTAATLAIGAVALIPPFGFGHSQAQTDRHQAPRQQLAAAFPLTPAALSQPRVRGAHGAGVRKARLHQSVAGARVSHMLRPVRTAPRFAHRARGGAGAAAGGGRSLGLTQGSPGTSSQGASGGSIGGSGPGTGGRSGEGSGGGSSRGAGGGPTGVSGGGTSTSGSGSGSVTNGPVVGTAGGSGGGVATAPASGTTGVTSTGATSSGGTSGGGTSGGGTNGGGTSGGGTSGGGTSGGGTSGGGTTGGGPPPGLPTAKTQCMDGGYATLGFKNQGQCIASAMPQSVQP